MGLETLQGQDNGTSHTYYQAIFEFSQDAIFVEDFEGKILDANAAACRLLGYSRQELLNMHVMELLRPQDRDKVQNMLQQQDWISGGKAFTGYNLSKTGLALPVEVRINDFWQDGRQYLIASVRDISERVEANRKIESQNQFFKALNQVSMALLSRLDLDTILHSVLEHVGELFGTPDASIALPGENGKLQQNYGTGRYQGTGLLFQPGEGLLGTVWQSGQPQVVSDYRYWPRRIKHPLAELAKTCVAIPLKDGNKIIGVLGMDFYDKVREFSQDDMERFSLFGQVAALALLNSSLYTSLARSEKHLQEKNQALRAAYAELSASAAKLGKQFVDLQAKEEEIRCLSLYDAMTGVYNRLHFEETLKRLKAKEPLGLIIADLDGLKVINDTLGHQAGDLALQAFAKLLQETFKGQTMIARIGGDEFAVLLPHNSASQVQADCNALRRRIEAYNKDNPTRPISVSLGFAVSGRHSADIKAIFNEADNNMYREKLHSLQSRRSAIVQALITALEARDFQTEGHCDRLQHLMELLATALTIPEQQLRELVLFARFHDIGKVGIPDHILFKPAALTPEETAVMRQHSDIGHRIALSAPELEPVADWILKHHEHWDGSGYPLGLAGHDIPLACRMLGIIDAYDAMTSDRPYRTAMGKAEAVRELQQYAGRQFDPHLVKVFLERVLQETS